jgi:lipoprotein-releasing system permease protein
MLSIMVVMWVTAALVIILSVFNGMEDLIRKLFESFDPPIKIESKVGKSFLVSDSLLTAIKKTDGVWHLTEVAEDNAMVNYKDQTDVVRLKGVSDDFLLDHRMDSVMLDGKLKLEDTIKRYAIIGAGLQYKLSISLHNEFAPLVMYYPNRKKLRSGGTNMASHLNSGALHPVGVFAIEKQFDDEYIIAPLSFALDLFAFEKERTSLEVSVLKGHRIKDVQARLQNQLGPRFLVLNSDEQHATLIKALKVEKLAVSVILCSVLAVASVGIYFCLSVLVLRKRKDMGILMALGATTKTIRNIFLLEGQLIAFTGAAIGLLLGFGICYIQEKYGYFKMGMNTSVVDAYPVEMQVWDFVAVSAVVIVLTFFASIKPALNASSSKKE